jgi:chromosomal replication initiator protein
MGADSHKSIWPIPLTQIEETVSAHLGPGRVSGNASGPCLSRQVSMYLAKHVGGGSLPKIGRFYNGRHHTTVLHPSGWARSLGPVI